jgi:CMP-N-acetylneuraminic acid synthetase
VSHTIVALVPMRHHSERVPGKNYRFFAGRPLYHYIIKNLLACHLITKIVIDTDSAVIMEDAAHNFPQIRLIERPMYLRDGKTPINEVLLYDISLVSADFYLQTHSTNPLLRTETINQAINLFLVNCPTYDSLFSVTRVQTRLWDQLARAINHNPATLIRTQDLPPTYEENSCLYLFTRQILEQRRNRLGERPLMFEIGRTEAWDIDEELDFWTAEFLYNKLMEEHKQQ